MDKKTFLQLYWFAFVQIHAKELVVSHQSALTLEMRAKFRNVKSPTILDSTVLVKRPVANTETTTTAPATGPDKCTVGILFGALTACALGCAVIMIYSGIYYCSSSTASCDFDSNKSLLGVDTEVVATDVSVLWLRTRESIATLRCLPHETVKGLKLRVEEAADTPAWLLKAFHAVGQELQDDESIREIGGTEILLSKDDVQIERQQRWRIKWEQEPTKARAELVEELTIHFPVLGDAIQKVARSKLPSELYLNSSSATDEFVRDIRQTEPKLKAINFSSTHVSYECVMGFIRYYPSLERIVLDRYPVNDDDLVYILQICPRLNSIKIHQTNVGPAGVAKLEEAGFKEESELCLQAMHTSLDGEDLMRFIRQV